MKISTLQKSLPVLLGCAALMVGQPAGQNAGGGQPGQPAGAKGAGAKDPVLVGDPLSVWLVSQITGAQAGQAKSTPTSAISLDRGSTSLVDQTSGPDLLNAALSLSPVTSSAGSSGNNGTGTVTASLYSVYALATKQDPLDPLLYDKSSSVLLRQVSLTIGHESQTNTGTSVSANSGNASSSGQTAQALSPSNMSMNSSTNSSTTPNGIVYGSRFLIVNQRDATSIVKNSNLRKEIDNALGALGGPIGAYKKQLEEILTRNGVVQVGEDLRQIKTDQIDAFVNKLDHNSAEYKAIQMMIANLKAEVKDLLAANTLNRILRELQGRAQFAVDFQTIQRTGMNPSDYRGELIFDQGYHQDNFHLTLNGSYDYSASPIIGGDLRTERGAVGMSYNLTRVGATSLHSPLQIQLSGEGTRTERKYGYRAQFQVIIPITAGVSFPASFGYANEVTELRQFEKGVYGKFGIAFDFSKLGSLLQSQK